jgi:DNA (cytosine-5)-methyltransferase 1
MNVQTVDTNTQNEYLQILDEAWQQHLAPRSDNAPTVISLFAGCGGSSLGYSMAGFRELLAVEWNDNAVETFELNFPDVPIYHGDIAKLSSEHVFEITGLQSGELDILDGSPPCQGFSTAGKRILEDDRNQLFREYVRLLRGLKPKVFVMENVSGMVKGKMKLIFAEVMRELKASGYRVKCQLMNAMYFNVPQSRQRLIFIGIRDDLEIEPSHPKPERKPFTVGNVLKNADISGLPSFNDKYAKLWNVIPLSKTRLTSSAYHATKQGGFNNCVKINPLLPSCTLPKLQTGHGFASIVRWDEPRALSVGEAKRLQSFHDEYQCIGDYSTQWERIGNSVPPLFMRSIARHIRDNILQPKRVDDE